MSFTPFWKSGLNPSAISSKASFNLWGAGSLESRPHCFAPTNEAKPKHCFARRADIHKGRPALCRDNQAPWRAEEQDDLGCACLRPAAQQVHPEEKLSRVNKGLFLHKVTGRRVQPRQAVGIAFCLMSLRRGRASSLFISKSKTKNQGELDYTRKLQTSCGDLLQEVAGWLG